LKTPDVNKQNRWKKEKQQKQKKRETQDLLTEPLHVICPYFTQTWVKTTQIFFLECNNNRKQFSRLTNSFQFIPEKSMTFTIIET